MATPFRPVLTRNYSFMTCTIKVDTSAPGWEKTVRIVLSKIHGVRGFKMDDYGFIEVSGVVHPELLIKKLSQVGKRPVLCSMRYGDCSSNLYRYGPNMPIRSTPADNHAYYYDLYGNVDTYDGHGGHHGHNGFYDHGYGYNRPFARLAHELCQRRAPPPPPPPRHTVYIPSYINDGPGCCSLM